MDCDIETQSPCWGSQRESFPVGSKPAQKYRRWVAVRGTELSLGRICSCLANCFLLSPLQNPFHAVYFQGTETNTPPYVSQMG